MDQHRRALGQVHRPSAGRRRRSSSRACRRCRAGRAGGSTPGRALVEYSATSSTASSTPAVAARAARTWSGSGVPPKSRPSTNGSIATSRLPLSPSAEASTIVDRPWWLPISRASEPGPSRRASSWSSRPCSGLSQPGTRSACSQAREKASPEGRESVGNRDTNQANRRGYTHAAHYWEGVSHRGVGGVRQGPAGLAALRRRLTAATARPDHVGHQVRPDRRPGRLPRPAPCTCGTPTPPSGSCRTRPTATCSRKDPSSCSVTSPACPTGWSSGSGRRCC